MKAEASFPILRALAGGLAAALLAGCAGEPAGSDATEFPEEPLMTLLSDDGTFTIEVRTAPTQPPSRGSIAVDLAIATVDGEPRDDLMLQVVPWMSDMAHGTSTTPEIVPAGDGHYEIGPVDMFMSGRWELLTEIEGPAEDSAKIVFEIP